MSDSFQIRRNNLLNFTLTELILLLLFLILLAAAVALSNMHKGKKQLQEENNQLHQQVLILGDKVEKLENQNATLRKTLEDLLGKGEYLEETIEELVGKLELTDTLENKIENLEAEVAELVNENTALNETIEQLTEESPSVAELQEKINELEAQNTSLKSKMIEGVGPPPCWIEPGTEKDPDFLFDLILHSNGIQFRKDYPSNRTDDFELLPIKVDYSKHYKINEFKKVTSALNIYAREQKDLHPDGCRFYITIYVNLDEKMQLYIEYMSAIESVFLRRTQIRYL
jgi:cell division protein FtsB|tara:strand:- start:422 stop:1276 length:855 start_codon:yes stop_codon:yes gene_type:complete